MSGWDKPSRPTWDPQDGPEDSTQAFPAPDGPGADDRWSQPAGSGWGGSGTDGGQDLGRGDFDAPDFGGLSVPGLGRGSDLGPAGYDRREPAFPPEPNGVSSDQNGFPREFEQRKPGATLTGRDLPGRDLPSRDLPSRDLPARDLPSREVPGRGGYGSGSQASARDEPPWPGPARQETSRQESARPDYGRAAENGRAGEYPRPGDYGRPDPARADYDRPAAPDQDFPRREPGRAEFSAYSTYSGTPEQAEQAPPPVNRADAELAARMDPALQDFFAPTKPDPRYVGGRPSLAAQPPGLPGPGQPALGQSGPERADQGQEPPRGGDGRGPRRPVRAADPWEDPAGYPTGSQPVLRRPGSPGGGRDKYDSPTGSRRNLIIAIAAVVVIVVVVGAYLVLKPSGNNNTNASAGSTPTASASTSASTPASSPAATPKSSSSKNPNVAGSASSAGAYVLSAPSTAAGYPIGTDPHFLATATSTAATIEQTAVKGGAGTVAGSPVSASYTLPDEQTIEFVGYQGTFNPTTVMANLKSYGSSESTYPAGPNGGELACANTTATASTPSGGVCVWVTKSTLGFTEFFTQANGPEALNSAQSKGAEDTVNLRASVEKLKS
jgi:hypothetical protein